MIYDPAKQGLSTPKLLSVLDSREYNIKLKCLCTFFSKLGIYLKGDLVYNCWSHVLQSTVTP